MRDAEDEPRTLSDAAFQRIKADIVIGALRPGAKLKIGDLVRHYRVGSSPLREALARLSSDHLVILQGQRGFTVAPISRQELEDLTCVRQLIECEAVVRAIDRGDVEWEARIVAAYFRLQRAHQQSAGRGLAWSHEWERCNRDFHDAIVSQCGSHWLLRLQQSLYAQSERYRHIAFENPRVPRDGDAEHKAIMDACLARKSGLARRLTAEHIAKTAQAVTPLLPEAEERRRDNRMQRLLGTGLDHEPPKVEGAKGSRAAAGSRQRPSRASPGRPARRALAT